MYIEAGNIERWKGLSMLDGDKRVVVARDPGRFRTTAAFYSRCRVPYPPDVFDFMATTAGLRSGGKVLDLGTGTGNVAIPFAARGFEVAGIDPEQEMIDEARRVADEAGVHVDLFVGDAEHFDLAPLEPARLVTIGRAFHWMDRDAVLARLVEVVPPGGGVALLDTNWLPTATNIWFQAQSHFLSTFSTASSDFWNWRRQRNLDADEEVLRRSAFSELTRYGRIEERTVTVDELIGRALSQAATSPAQLGERREAMEQGLASVLAGFSADGLTLTELVEHTVLLAVRPEVG